MTETNTMKLKLFLFLTAIICIDAVENPAKKCWKDGGGFDEGYPGDTSAGVPGEQIYKQIVSLKTDMSGLKQPDSLKFEDYADKCYITAARGCVGNLIETIEKFVDVTAIHHVLQECRSDSVLDLMIANIKSGGDCVKENFIAVIGKNELPCALTTWDEAQDLKIVPDISSLLQYSKDGKALKVVEVVKAAASRGLDCLKCGMSSCNGNLKPCTGGSSVGIKDNKSLKDNPFKKNLEVASVDSADKNKVLQASKEHCYLTFSELTTEMSKNTGEDFTPPRIPQNTCMVSETISCVLKTLETYCDANPGKCETKGDIKQDGYSAPC